MKFIVCMEVEGRSCYFAIKGNFYKEKKVGGGMTLSVVSKIMDAFSSTTYFSFPFAFSRMEYYRRRSSYFHFFPGEEAHPGSPDQEAPLLGPVWGVGAVSLHGAC